MSIPAAMRGLVGHSDRYAISRALRVAAEIYDRHAISCAPANLQYLFEEQAQSARRWADLIDECDELRIT